ncbi:hypothetical protein PFISCL1PPCAC_25280, partial [Pristionchus fissidentatus]
VSQMRLLCILVSLSFLGFVKSATGTNDFDICFGVTSCLSPPDTLNEKLFKWEIQTAFKKTPVKTSFSASNKVEINPNMALVMRRTKDATETTFKIASENSNECKIILKKNKKEIAKAEMLSTSGESIKLDGAKDSQAMIAVFDPECKVYTDASKDSSISMSLIFLKDLQTRILDNVEVEESNPQHGHYIYGQDHEIVPEDVRESNVFFKFDGDLFKDKTKLKNCFSNCKYGSILEITADRNRHFAHVFELSKDCEWMTIHLNADQLSDSTEISLRHGFVTLSRELKANIMDFRKIDSKDYEVKVTFQIKDRRARLTVANAHGQALSTENDGHPGNFKFAFSSPNCLVKTLGESEYKFIQGKNIRAFVDADTFGAARYSSVPGTAEPEYAKPTDPNGAAATEKTGNPNQEREADAALKVNSTAPPAVEKAEEVFIATKKKPNSHVISTQEIEEYERLKKETEDALSGKTVRYVTWAIPAGFATGSFVTFLIANLLLFIFRRSVFTRYYKEMYKRYGSDTTMGTTMGKTMGGETIGGGSTTVGGGTTMGGGTTAGDQTTATSTVA